MRFARRPVHRARRRLRRRASKYLVAGVWLNEDAVDAHLAARGVRAGARAEAVRALVQQRVDKVNAELASYETIKRFAVIDQPLTVDGGLLTPTLKVRRKKVYEAFRAAARGALRMKHACASLEPRARCSRAKRPPVGTTPADVVHTENKWRLLRYRPRRAGARSRRRCSSCRRSSTGTTSSTSCPGKSFAEWLRRARPRRLLHRLGHARGDEDRYLSFDDVCDRYLGRAVRVAHRRGAEAHVLGLLPGRDARGHPRRRVHPERVASLTRARRAGALRRGGAARRVDAVAAVRAAGARRRRSGNVPWQLMQSSFHMLRPTLDLAKTRARSIDRACDDEFLDGFLAHRDLGKRQRLASPARSGSTWVEELYRGDAFVRGDFALGGRAGAARGRRPARSLVVTFEHDNIVPKASATVLFDRAGSADKHALHLSGGHVGAVVSRGAAKKLWPALADFWAARETQTPPGRPHRPPTSTGRRAALHVRLHPRPHRPKARARRVGKVPAARLGPELHRSTRAAPRIAETRRVGAGHVGVEVEASADGLGGGVAPVAARPRGRGLERARVGPGGEVEDAATAVADDRVGVAVDLEHADRLRGAAPRVESLHCAPARLTAAATRADRSHARRCARKPPLEWPTT